MDIDSYCYCYIANVLVVVVAAAVLIARVCVCVLWKLAWLVWLANLRGVQEVVPMKNFCCS